MKRAREPLELDNWHASKEKKMRKEPFDIDNWLALPSIPPADGRCHMNELPIEIIMGERWPNPTKHDPADKSGADFCFGIGIVTALAPDDEVYAFFLYHYKRFSVTPSLHVDYLLHFGGTAKISNSGDLLYSRVLVDILSLQFYCDHSNRFVLKRAVKSPHCWRIFEEHNEIWSSTCRHMHDGTFEHQDIREPRYDGCRNCERQHHVILTLLGLKRE
jgi:hypothetical protein